MLGYKLARPDGWDFYTGKTINYRGEGVYPHTVRVPNANPALGVCSAGVGHASTNPNDCFVGAKIPCSCYLLDFTPFCGDAQKWGWLEAVVLEEKPQESLDALFGWRYSEACHPLNPLLVIAESPTADNKALLHAWASVGATVYDSAWASSGASVGASVYDSAWASVGASVGASVYDSVYDSVWASVGASVYTSVYASVYASVAASVYASLAASLAASVDDLVYTSVYASVYASLYASVCAYIGSLFPNITRWQYIANSAREYPFQPSVELWRRGFVPSFDGKTWRLHAGPTAQIVLEVAQNEL